MQTHIYETKLEASQIAAKRAGDAIREAIRLRGRANIIIATGASQFDVLQTLVQTPEIRWDLVTVFHLDEYVGLPITHPASFRKFLWERFQKLLPLPLRGFHYINGETDPEAECDRVGQILAKHPIDIAVVGIGENGHLAFNDPPADFHTEQPYIVVTLDEACRRQQMGEGWFPTLDSVPTRAISMSIKQILKSSLIVCTVPDLRKAEAVKNALEGPVSNTVPASILQQHPNCSVYLDTPAASRLRRNA
jgi:glucosamine-6-phosphate deaminase